MPSPKAIYLYWEDKLERELPSVDALLNEWAHAGSTLGKNPWDVCWSCGIDTRPIERAHLQARVYDGLDNAANLVLLCYLCHRQQPDYTTESAKTWLDQRAFVANYGVTIFGNLPYLMGESVLVLAQRSHDNMMAQSKRYAEAWHDKTVEEQREHMLAVQGLVREAVNRAEQTARFYHELNEEECA